MNLIKLKQQNNRGTYFRAITNSLLERLRNRGLIFSNYTLENDNLEKNVLSS